MVHIIELELENHGLSSLSDVLIKVHTTLRLQGSKYAFLYRYIVFFILDLCVC